MVKSEREGGERERNVYYCTNVARRGETRRVKRKRVSARDKEVGEREKEKIYLCTYVARRGEKSKSKCAWEISIRGLEMTNMCFKGSKLKSF